MLHFMDVTINCDDDTAKTYEHILGEGKPELKFPLKGCQVTHHGGRAVISLAQPGRKALIIDRLRAGEPTEGTHGKESTYTLSGSSEKLYMQGVNPEDANVTFVITDWKASAGSVA